MVAVKAVPLLMAGIEKRYAEIVRLQACTKAHKTASDPAATTSPLKPAQRSTIQTDVKPATGSCTHPPNCNRSK